MDGLEPEPALLRKTHDRARELGGTPPRLMRTWYWTEFASIEMANVFAYAVRSDDEAEATQPVLNVENGHYRIWLKR